MESGIWNGTNFTGVSTPDSVNDTLHGQHNVGAAWVGTTGMAGILTETGTDDFVDYNYYDSTRAGSITRVEGSVASFNDHQSLEAYALPFMSKAYYLSMSRYLELNGLIYEGSSVEKDGSEDIATGLLTLDTICFDMSQRLPQSLRFTNHPSGQVVDNIGDVSSVTNREIFAFRLSPNSGSMTVNTLAIDLEVSGMLVTDLSNLRVMVDENGDGTIGATETTSLAGTGTVSLLNGSGNVTFNSSFSLTQPMDLILTGSLANLAEDDVINLSLGGQNSAQPQFGGAYNGSHRHGSDLLQREGDVLVAYIDKRSEGGERDVRLRVFDGENDRFSGELAVASSNSVLRFVEAQTSTADNTMMLLTQGLYKDGNQVAIQLHQFDGANWSTAWQEWSHDKDEVGHFAADIAYFASSGNALAVYGNGSTNPQYRFFTASSNSWSA